MSEYFASQQNTKQLRQFFLIYCKNISNFLFWVSWTCLVTFIKKDNTNLSKLLTFICMPKMTSIPNFFLRYCKLLFANLLLWVIWQCLIMHINNDNINLVGNFDVYLQKINVQKITLNSFLRYCKEIANLLFWVLWECLVTHT